MSARKIETTCEVPGCDAPAGSRMRGHPIHTTFCTQHGGLIYRFRLWLGNDPNYPEPIGGPDDNFDSARAWWERENARRSGNSR